MDRHTICMMEVDPRLIEIRRNYYERLRKQYEMMRNAFPAAWMQQQAANSQNILTGLMGGIGGGFGSGINDLH